ncbi:MAG: CHASE domain-containing protein [Sulfuricurvum sp.]|jgi:PAS domain S-box-containing protein|uniref:CHASE domain-containing protein n=1 Tax=Sulfuricurvum sp. TaxID=2025608 RepID=UPI0025F2B990|nr:CHASE domain-containing protein [Sulfuricurvum sp.]MCK9374342.1 CHASE domain-containing protein [Sulfuricurvum sp.]
MIKKVHLAPLLRNDILNSKYITYIGLIFSVVVVAVVWKFSQHYFENRAQNLFEHHAYENLNAIERRIERYENALRSGVGFLQGSDYVSREEWRRFVQNLDPAGHYPGVQGIGFSMMLYPEEVEKIEVQMRFEGFPTFTLTPKGVRDRYSAILYLEPLDQRNRNAIGYDMFSEPIRRAAMQRAADTALAAISGKVKLLQEIDSDVQAGFLMYLPFYKTDKKIETIEERRKALVGFVYSPFRMKDLMRAIGLHDDSLLFEIYDGEKHSESNLLYRSFTPSGYVSQHRLHQTILIGGKKWDVFYSSSPRFDAATDSHYPIFLTLSGLVFCFFLLYIILELFRSRKMLQHNTVALESSRSWLNRVLEASIDGIHILDSKGNLIEYSPSFIQLLGYDEHEAKTLSVYDWEMKLSLEQIQDALDSLSEIPTTFETVFCRKDGSLLDVEITAHRIVMDGTSYLYASSRVITERKKFEQSLRSEKETAQKYLDIVDVMIVVVDTHKNVQLINRKGCEVIGYPVNEVIGKNWIDHFLPERFRSDVDAVSDRFMQVSEEPFYYENPVLTKSGEERLIAWRNTALFDPDGRLIGLLGSGEDVTDIRSTQEKLKESEEFYRTIFSSVSEAICILYNNTIIDCNEEAIRLFGMSREALIGINIFDTADYIECQENSFDFYLNTAYQGKCATAECSLTLKYPNCTTKIVEFTFSGFGGNSENKLVMIARDITQKMEEERILRMNTRQAQMGEMISMIAHQWRQPLTIINAITSQMRLTEMMKDESDPLFIDNLIKIEEQSTHLSQTISAYRDFFRPDKPKEQFTISLLIKNALSLIDHTLKNRGIRIEHMIKHDFTLLTYRNEILQVVIVLLKNSLDAFEEHGISDGQILITLDRDDEYGIIRFADNAGGIAPEIINKLFIPYFTTKTKNNGTGLGLYMSKMVIQDHCNGLLEVESEGVKSVFTIKLPREGGGI